MPRVDLVMESDIIRSPRVMQIEGLFDVPASEKSIVRITGDLLIDDHPWQVGLIFGPSGSGKSSVARYLWAEQMSARFEWARNRSLIDAFPRECSIKDITAALTAVGFGAPPSWLRPFHLLSTGEQFRADVARRMLSDESPIVIDEFTSVVDRQVARVGSYAIQKAIRRTSRQFVAVSCHDDIIDWLQPDWTFRPDSGEFTWRCLRPRPTVELVVYPVGRSAWSLFRHHHYLSADLSKSAHCFGGFIDDRLVAFTSYLHFPHPKVNDIKMGHRLVVLPDYQGIGIGGRLDDWLGQYLHEAGFRYHNTISSPAMIRFYVKSPRWRLLHSGLMSVGSDRATSRNSVSMRTRHRRYSASRQTASFAYVPLVMEGMA